MKTICLNMIVKNERKAIRKLLESARGIIDYWVIVDTGSTDGTQALIREIMQGTPGELIEKPWVDFATNRNEALEMARTKADYILVLDADHKLVVSRTFDKNRLWQDFYMIKLTREGSDHYRPLLISNDRGWFWEGVIHETIIHSEKMQGEVLKDLYVECSSMEGWRSQDPQKYYKDVEVLKKAIQDEPWNSRYYFYIAESYQCIYEDALALQYYEKRSEMNGEAAETFWSLFSVACLREKLNKDPMLVVQSYTRAYEFDPSRAEPLHRLALFFMNCECPSLGLSIAQYALNLKNPNVLNSNFYPWVYEWGLYVVIGDCAGKMKNYSEAEIAYRKAVSCKTILPEVRAKIEINLQYISSQQNHSSH